MSQSTVLSAGKTAAVSSDIAVAAGSVVKVALFSAAPGRLPQSVKFAVLEDTPGTENVVARLDDVNHQYVLAGPGTYRVSRPAYDGDQFGVFVET